ncbi:hypothetical protein [Candidatus Kryptobacter tengchongensis]|uniref:Uncharacterized protein n=1 Tax=Kryptobacter tengchongensis TaxID=1643429 RepID=A0A656DAA8_KRYT1|nr:hypothetical protein [Candidatus Kryptobacter tengchongensis]CUT04422.1 hypothetical protein JGI24_01489 [Candidatus Kryptobacter tengchongensis]
MPVTTRITPSLTPDQRRNLENLVKVLRSSGNSELADLLNDIVSDLVILVDGRPATPAEIEEILKLLMDKGKYEVIIEEK